MKPMSGQSRKVSGAKWESLSICSSRSNGSQKKSQCNCHPPVQKPKNLKSPITCKCPSGSKNNLSTCIPPLPSCGQNKSSQSFVSKQSTCSSQSITQFRTNSCAGNCCSHPHTPLNPNSLPSSGRRTNPSIGSGCSSPQPPSNPSTFPCPAPLPSLLPRKQPSGCCGMLNLQSTEDSEDFFNQTRENNSVPIFQNRSQSAQCPPRPRPACCPPCTPCPPPECMMQCPEPTPTSLQPPKGPTFIRKPPFSSFLQERMPSQPIQRRSFMQTVVTEECIDDDETSSWLEPNTIVTEVRTSSVTFPPNCCVSTYEDYLNAALKSQPKPEVKLPVIIDECDPCAEIPREISPWEDVENVTHTCGTQTLENEASPNNKKIEKQ